MKHCCPRDEEQTSGKSFSFHTRGVGTGLGWKTKWSSTLLPLLEWFLAHYHQLSYIPTLSQPWWGGSRTRSQPGLQGLCCRKSWQVSHSRGTAPLLSLQPTAPCNCLLCPGLELALSPLLVFHAPSSRSVL